MTPYAAIVGSAHATRGEPRDMLDGVTPAAVVRPGSVDEVRACVRAAAAAGHAIVASGLGAHRDVGGRPRRVDVLLRVDRLAAVVDHQAADMTVTVQAGCPLATLDATLATAGQWLPLDPPAPARTTVGGLIAANLWGPLRASQGAVRDLLLGLRVVEADGTLVAGGGRVVKNVAGYDLPKLHVGALGTLGVLVEATFKVRPRPEREEAVVIAAPRIERAAETALAVLDLAVPPLWLEVAGPGALADGPGEATAVAVGLGGTADEVTHGRQLVLACAQAAGLRATAVGEGAALRARLGGFVLEPAAAVLRAATLPTEVGAVQRALEDAARAAGSAVRTLAAAAIGVVRAAIAEAAAVPEVVRALRPGLEAAGGSCVVERAGAEVKTQIDVWGNPGPAAALMRRVKEACDPHALLAPGRFVGGL